MDSDAKALGSLAVSGTIIAAIFWSIVHSRAPDTPAPVAAPVETPAPAPVEKPGPSPLVMALAIQAGARQALKDSEAQEAANDAAARDAVAASEADASEVAETPPPAPVETPAVALLKGDPDNHWLNNNYSGQFPRLIMGDCGEMMQDIAKQYGRAPMCVYNPAAIMQGEVLLSYNGHRTMGMIRIQEDDPDARNIDPHSYHYNKEDYDTILITVQGGQGLTNSDYTQMACDYSAASYVRFSNSLREKQAEGGTTAAEVAKALKMFRDDMAKNLHCDVTQ